MDKTISGIHHVTAIASDPQRNMDFYTGVLGLRLIKLTVNFDAPDTYHLYYGDDLGNPGTILTFFPWPGAPRGRIGAGQATATAFSIPAGAVGYWAKRLKDYAVSGQLPIERFGDQVLTVSDPDGLRLELIAHQDNRQGWPHGPVPAEHAIRGFHGVTLSIAGYERTAELLTDVLGFKLIAEDGNRYRYSIGTKEPGTFIDILNVPGAPRGNGAAGTVHHIAMRTSSYEEHGEWRKTIALHGHNVTPIIDRQYFHSIYFREPGGVLFEIATDTPGFPNDEAPEQLGTALKLPPQYEPQRSAIEAALPPLRLPTGQTVGRER